MNRFSALVLVLALFLVLACLCGPDQDQSQVDAPSSIEQEKADYRDPVLYTVKLNGVGIGDSCPTTVAPSRTGLPQLFDDTRSGLTAWGQDLKWQKYECEQGFVKGIHVAPNDPQAFIASRMLDWGPPHPIWTTENIYVWKDRDVDGLSAYYQTGDESWLSLKQE